MSAETGHPLSKVDSAVEAGSPPKDVKKPGHRRGSSTVSDVYNIADLGTS